MHHQAIRSNLLFLRQALGLSIAICFFLACHAPKSMPQVDKARPTFNFVTDTTFESVLALAKQENKIIFIDFYTDWCRACKEVDKAIFLGSPSAATFYNKYFINYKVNGESDEGKALVKQYKISRYPTYIFCNPDGKQLLGKSGKPNFRDFIRMGESALLRLTENNR